MRLASHALTIGAAFIGAAASAQIAPVPLSPPPGTIATVGGTAVAVLRTGTQVPLKMAEQLTTKGKNLRVGQRFRLEVAEDVKVQGVTVIPAGSPAVGEVTEVRNKGMWGKSGKINARVLYVQVNGRQIRLTGSFDDKGVTGTAGVVAAIAFVPVAGFFTTGTSATLPLGGAVTAFVDEDVPLAFAATPAQAPLVVTPGAQMTVTTPTPAAPPSAPPPPPRKR